MAATWVTKEQRFERLRTLTEVSRALTYTTSTEAVLRLAVERAAELVGADKVVIMLTDAEGLLVVRAAHGIEEQRVRELREPLNETLVRRLQDLLDYALEESFLSVPLVAQGEVTGLLAAVRRSGQPCTDDDEWLLSALADQAAVALENARLTDAVREERDERSRVLQAQGRAHATLGHELRSPLTAIQSYSSLLLEGLFGRLNDRQRESVSRIKMSGQHLLAVIDDVLDMARINAGTISLSNTDVRIAEVLAEAVKMLQPLTAEKNQELRTSSGEELVVRADASRLRQAFLNLIGNAIKYTPPGGRIEVSAFATERGGKPCAAIAVTDNGAGMTAHTLAGIFEPFSRGEVVNGEPGLGLGLFISRELIRQMGGEIEVQSEPGVGSTFTSFLPLSIEASSRQKRRPQD